MKYVIGIDLGTSAVKTILVNQLGEIVATVSKSYPLIQEKSGYSEQDPEIWVTQTLLALAELKGQFNGNPEDIEGISYSGQMHGLVLLNDQLQVLRPAILWNDTRTTAQCERLSVEYGDDILKIANNRVLEGFTLPKLIWMKENEPEIFLQTSVFLLPKDYVRFRMTGLVQSEFSDASGTLLLDNARKVWNTDLCQKLGISENICPPLVESHAMVGKLLPIIAEKTGLSINTKVFAGGADNACGSIGAGVLSPQHALCSIGTSGVILSYEDNEVKDYEGKIHFFNHANPESFYSMGVTLSAGQSLAWLKDTFAKDQSFDEFLEGFNHIPPGSNGLLFTPYLFGERTPYADSSIRGSFIGIDASHKQEHFVRAVLEGITFSLNESIEIYRKQGKSINTIISIGGGAKNDTWLQMQADIFNARVVKINSEQGPALGAAMLAAFGAGWFSSLEKCAEKFIHATSEFIPCKRNVEKYRELYKIYKLIYMNTKEINARLQKFRS